MDSIAAGHVVAARLDTKPPESGLPTLDEVLAPVGEGASVLP